MAVQFSEAELKLIKYFNCEMLLTARTDVFLVYQTMVCNAFIRKDESPATAALRRCFEALVHCTVYRGTTAFDALATFEDAPPKKRSRKK